MIDPRAWEGVELTCDIHGAVVYGRSKLSLALLIDPPEPTDEERARGFAARHIEVTAEQAWTCGVCLRCGLPLPLHPDDRRRRAKRRYCRQARAQPFGWSAERSSS